MVHAIQHLPHRVYFRFATFEFLEREADGKMLCELHQHCLIQLFVLALFGKPGQRVSQSVLRTRRHPRHLVLKLQRGCRWVLSSCHLPEAGKGMQDTVDIFLAGLA